MKIDIFSRPDIKKVQKLARYYVYNPNVPTMFSDVERFVEHLKVTHDKNILAKIAWVKKVLLKRWLELREENRFLEWYELKIANNWMTDYCVPRYDTSSMSPREKKTYTDRLLRYARMTNPYDQQEKYNRLKLKHSKAKLPFPPAMASNNMWWEFFLFACDIKKLEYLDECLVEIFNSYQKKKSKEDDSRAIALRYLKRRKKQSADSIPRLGIDSSEQTIHSTQQQTS
jgi:hypothetical protein